MAASTTPSAPPGRDRYPQNVKRTYKSKHALIAYHNRVTKEEPELFVPEGKPRFVLFWDLHDAANAFQPEHKASTEDELDLVLKQGLPNPLCRFIFFHTANARGKLCCSRNQLEQVLGFHDIMPAFLDFCFEFRNRDKPNINIMFRAEDFLNDTSLPQIQHAFNIMAPEHDSKPDSPYPWSIRHTTLYHSFCPRDGRSVWIAIKGNKLIRERITSSAEVLRHCTSGAKNTPTAQFRFTLALHISVVEWCTENWGLYIESLELRVRQHEAKIRLAPVEALSKKPPRPGSHHMRGPTSRTTGLSRSSTGPRSPGIGGRIRSNLSRMASGLSSHKPPDPAFTGGGMPGQPSQKPKIAEEEEQLEDMFTFDDLQAIRRVTDDAELASMIILENRRIIITLRERYEVFSQSRAFEDIESLDSDVVNFCKQLSILEGDLESHHARLQLFLRGLERNEEMFKGILQYGNMRVGEHYARSAEVSARVMEEWTERMHDIAAETEHETISMHGITVLTLIFLPGTFVSTLFSSGIWNFDDSKSHEMGDWETRVPALKLFVTIAIPLMALALTFWWVTYSWAKRQHGKAASRKERMAGDVKA